MAFETTFQEEELLIVSEEKHQAIRVVDWNGKRYLVKQSKYIDKASDETRYGKVKALQLRDLEVIHERWNEIIDLLG